MRQRERASDWVLERNPRPSRGRCLSPRLTASHFRPFQVSGKICRLQRATEAQHMFSFSISAVCFAATSVPSNGPVDVGEEAKTLANRTLHPPANPPPPLLASLRSPSHLRLLALAAVMGTSANLFEKVGLGGVPFFGTDRFFFFMPKPHLIGPDLKRRL